MKTDTAVRDPKTAQQTTRNSVLAGRFLRQIRDDPSAAADIADGATVVLIPTDDSELAAGLRRLVSHEVEVGKTSSVRVIEGPRARLGEDDRPRRDREPPPEGKH